LRPSGPDLPHRAAEVAAALGEKMPVVYGAGPTVAAELERQSGAAVRIEAAGESRSERLLWTVMLGDLVSLELATIHGVEPLPIEAIDRLKSALQRD
jgi:hypothetical protein